MADSPLEVVSGAAAPAGFDASDLEVAEDASTEIQITNPKTNSLTGMFITVYSAESDRAKMITRQQINRRFKGAQNRRGNLALTAEELESEEMDMLVGCTKSWRDVNWNGKPLECTAQNVRFLYTQSPIIRKQVKDAVYDDTLFTKG